MNRKVRAIAVLGVIVAAGFVLYNTWRTSDFFQYFDNEGRYESTNLNYMGVIYSNRSDIYTWTGGYSESSDCPWGAVHNGLDFFLNNGSTVIAAAPGMVEEMRWRDDGSDDNIYTISITIRFNSSVQIEYVFEPTTIDPTDKEIQNEMLNVEVGDWVAKGDIIGEFLMIGGYAHIHFGTYMDGACCPKPFYSEEAYNEIMELVHSFEPGWELCYP